jgi:hypothetical protein
MVSRKFQDTNLADMAARRGYLSRSNLFLDARLSDGNTVENAMTVEPEMKLEAPSRLLTPIGAYRQLVRRIQAPASQKFEQILPRDINLKPITH